MSAIEAHDLFKVFGPKKALGQAVERAREGDSLNAINESTGCVVAVNNVSFEIDGPQIFVIMGLSGSGKSTLLRCINHLIRPTAGSVTIDGQKLEDMDKKAVRELRKEKMAMVFQHFGLLDHRDVLGNVGFGLELRGMAEKERAQKSKNALERVGLADQARSRVGELSGGMQQRVGLARALATEADILLMDEAFSALDPLIRTRMQTDFLALQDEMPKLVLFITHDLAEALRLGDRIAILKEGAIVQIDTPEQIIINPQTDYVEAFVENVDRSRVLTAGTTARDADATIGADSAPDEALRVMEEADTSYLYLIEDDRISGIIYRRDLEAGGGDRTTLTELKVDAPSSIHSGDHLLAVIPKMVESDVPLPVVDDQKRLVGVLSKANILESIARVNSHD